MKRKFFYIVFIAGLLTFSAMNLNAQNPRETAYLESIANIVGHDLYISYVYLGSLSDSYVYRVYHQKVAINFFNEYVDYIKIIQRQLELMREKQLVPIADIDYINMQIAAYESLRKQALEFLKYIETGESKYVETFEKHRIQSWTLIATILGIPEEIEKVYKK